VSGQQLAQEKPFHATATHINQTKLSEKVNCYMATAIMAKGVN